MHRIPKILAHNFDRRKTRTHSEPSRQVAKPKPRLERSYASKNINYEFSPSTNSASSSSSSSSSSSYSSSDEAPRSRSLEFDSSKTSFRFDGNDGELEIICKTLGLSGIDDFGIAPEEYEAMKVRSSSASVQLCDIIEPLIDRVIEVGCDNVDCTSIGDDDDDDVNFGLSSNLVASGSDLISTKAVGIRDLGFSSNNVTIDRSNMVCSRLKDSVRVVDVTLSDRVSEKMNECRGNGINGVRPPVLVPPHLALAVSDKECSSEDTLRTFVRDGDRSALGFEGAVCLDEDDGGTKRGIQVRNEDNDEEGRRGRDMRSEENCVLSESYSFTMSNSDDSSSSTTGTMSTSSANGRFRRVITDWQKGELLGRGSFGSVYEGIADNGFFFAVKEVSLLDQGDEGKQRISQLEQEIALLSRFEHENIVQYYGTKKDESHLYIFLELVTKGSLLSLYQKYYLKDPQVSAYTRQILRGLKYLHDRDVVHRDIKCANILVDTMGLVKLADFGLAKATKLNDVKSCKGTAFWMAPEVVRSLGYGLPADIWSLGCTVLEMLTRSFPYSNLEWMSALFRIGRGERPPIPDSLSNDARDFILKCLQVDPSLRPTAAQLLDHPFVKRPLPSSSVTSPQNFSRWN